LTQVGTERLADRLFRWGGRRTESLPPRDADAGASDDQVQPTKALGKFLAHLANTNNPVLVDLGPVVGANVAFFGEQFGCKIFVLDLHAEIDRAVHEGRVEQLADVLAGRFAQRDESVDGVLCWDVLDYLDKGAAARVAHELTRILRPGGALLGFFAAMASPEASRARYTIIDEAHVRARAVPALCGRQHVFANRDITRMFDGLTVVDSFLLLSKTREMLFRKPAIDSTTPEGGDSRG